MRRLIPCAVLLAMLVPSPAHAWFGMLDYLSGPGRWYGQLYDLRVACFGPEATHVKRLRLALAGVIGSTTRAALDPSLRHQAAVSWNAFGLALKALPTDFTSLKADGTLVASFAGRPLLVKDLTNASLGVLSSPVGSSVILGPEGLITELTAPPAEPAQAAPAIEVVPGSTSNRLTLDQLYEELRLGLLANRNPLDDGESGGLATLMRAAVKAVSLNEQMMLVGNGVGVFISLCRADETRRFGLDVNADLYQANSNLFWASDYTLRLSIFAGTLTYRIPHVANTIDVRSGAGLYSFSSRGISDFEGLVWLPLQGDFHAPPSWLAGNVFQRLGSLATFRFGFTKFVGGLDHGAFNPASPGQIEKEWVKTYAVYFNLTPLYRR